MQIEKLLGLVVTRVALALLVLTIACPALAEPSAADRAAAEALFREARDLMKQQKYADACGKLEESQRLDPQGGTLLNLAVCHARQGRTASAWVEFQEALDIARKAKRDDRVKLAKKELDKLDTQLARLTLDVPDEARVPGLRLGRGDEEVGEGGWGAAVPIDPGTEIRLSAKAAGYRDWNGTVTLRPAEQKTVVIPRLEKLPEAPSSDKRAKPANEVATRGSGRRTRRALAWTAGGVGLVAVAVGGFFGLRALSKKNATASHCNGALCDPEGLDLNDQAKAAATVSNIAFGVGLVALGTGTYLFLTSQPGNGEGKPTEAESARIRIAPSIGPAAGAILMSGQW